MQAQPLVSIVTPSYNQAEFLEETMLSVLDQDYPDIEYMVIDDGSTDGSVDIIRRHERRLAYWTTGPNCGQSHAINEGWRRTTGNIVAYLNSDDTYLPGTIRTAVDFLAANPDVGIAYGDCLAVDAHGATIEKYQARDFDLEDTILACRTPILQPAAFIRREVLQQTGLLDEALFIAMDFDLWLRAGLRFKMVHIPATLATYRLHSASKSVSKGATTGPDVIRIYEKLLRLPEFPESLRLRSRQVMSAAYRRAAAEYYAACDLKPARDMWLRAWALYPPALSTLDYARWLNTWLYPLRRPKTLNRAAHR